MPNASNVTAADPQIGGAAYVGATNTTLPTNATSTLTGFTELGYISTDGLKNNNSATNEKIKEWGGKTVLDKQTEKNDEFKVVFLEALNVNVLKEIYGAENVTGTLATGIHIRANSKELDERAFVFDMILRGGIVKREVIPLGKITALDEISYVSNGAVAYGVTISAHPDAEGDTHHEYIADPAESEEESEEEPEE